GGCRWPCSTAPSAPCRRSQTERRSTRSSPGPVARSWTSRNPPRKPRDGRPWALSALPGGSSMRRTTRVAALAVVAALTATVLLLRPDSPPAAAAAQPALADDLALVPADALAFVHVRAADLWKNDIFAPFRQTFEKAGPKALAALDAQF